jgi:hypothetical protein
LPKKREILSGLIKENGEKLEICRIRRDANVDTLPEHQVDYFISLLDSSIDDHLIEILKK